MVSAQLKFLCCAVPCRTQMAGQDSGLDVVNKARKAVSMVKVLQALQSILDMLQVRDAYNLVKYQADRQLLVQSLPCRRYRSCKHFMAPFHAR